MRSHLLYKSKILKSDVSGKERETADRGSDNGHSAGSGDRRSMSFYDEELHIQNDRGAHDIVSRTS